MWVVYWCLKQGEKIEKTSISCTWIILEHLNGWIFIHSDLGGFYLEDFDCYLEDGNETLKDAGDFQMLYVQVSG